MLLSPRNPSTAHINHRTISWTVRPLGWIIQAGVKLSQWRAPHQTQGRAGVGREEDLGSRWREAGPRDTEKSERKQERL